MTPVTNAGTSSHHPETFSSEIPMKKNSRPNWKTASHGSDDRWSSKTEPELREMNTPHW